MKIQSEIIYYVIHISNTQIQKKLNTVYTILVTK